MDHSHEHMHQETVQKKSSLRELAPVLIALSLTAVLALTVTYLTDQTITTFMRFYMGIFFLIFSALKLINIKGFVSAFKTYDILAKRIEAYAFAYPFIELGLGVMYILNIAVFNAAITTLIVMSIGIVGVTKALRSENKIQCACMGTFFDLPMTKVTFTENFLMILMAALMLGGILGN